MTADSRTPSTTRSLAYQRITVVSRTEQPEGEMLPDVISLGRRLFHVPSLVGHAHPKAVWEPCSHRGNGWGETT